MIPISKLVVRRTFGTWSNELTDVALCNLVNEHGFIRACNVTTTLRTIDSSSTELFDLFHCNAEVFDLPRVVHDESHVTDGMSASGNPLTTFLYVGQCFACSPTSTITPKSQVQQPDGSCVKVVSMFLSFLVLEHYFQHKSNCFFTQQTARLPLIYLQFTHLRVTLPIHSD